MRAVEAVIAKKYNIRFAKLGATPEASLWFSEERQFLRFKIISDVLDQALLGSKFSINDIGCGYGALFPYLIKRFPNKKFTYTGIDIAEKPIKFCKDIYSETNSIFNVGNIPNNNCDFSVMSGTYNYAPVQSSHLWQRYLFENLKKIWEISDRGIIFNISVAKEARITSQNISYFNKENVKSFCNDNLGKTSLFISDKLPKEATFFISRI